MDSLVAMLDSPPLIAWFTLQDTFMLRRRRGERMQAHPKVLSLPLGLRVQRAPFYERAIDMLEAWGPRTQPVLYIGSTLGVRQAVTAQLEKLHGARSIIGNGSSMAAGAFAQALLHSTFVASPPGMGADCYRHYEALAAGAIPMVMRTSVALSTLSVLPVLVVDDYSVANASTLRQAAKELIARIKAHRGRSLAPLTWQFWTAQIRRAARHATGATGQPIFALDAPPLSVYVPGRVRGMALWDMPVAHPRPWWSPDICPCSCGLCWAPTDGSKQWAGARQSNFSNSIDPAHALASE